MKKSVISVIIPFYHDEQWLKNCLNSLSLSIEKASLTSEYILVVNDPDFKKRKFNFPVKGRIIQNSENCGHAKGLDIGAKKAKGEWLLFINPDTVIDKNAFYYFSKHLSDPKIGIIGPRINLPDSSIQLTINKSPSLMTVFWEQSYLYKIWPFSLLLPKANISNYSHSHFVDALEGTYYLVRRKYFEEVGGMDEQFFMYFEDMDICKRISNLGYKILFEHKAKIVHFRSMSSAGNMHADIYVKSFRNYFTKYYSKTYCSFCLILLFFGSFLRQYYWFLKNKISSDELIKKRTVKMNKFYQLMTKECIKYLFSKY